MWTMIKPALVLSSVALNVALAGVWLTYTAISGVRSPEASQPASDSTVWCPLHRQLHVTADQWKEIEPHLRSFRASADEICTRIGELREGVIDELAAAQPDLDVVEAKQAEIREAQRTMQRMVVEQLMAEKKVLTADQQQRLFEMLRAGTDGGRHGPMLVPGRGQQGGIGRILRTGGQDH